MKKTLLLITLILSSSFFFPVKNVVAQTLYRPQRTIPGISNDCLNYMILETGGYVCLSYSQPVDTIPTSVSPEDKPVTEQQTDPVNNSENLLDPNSEVTPVQETPQNPTTVIEGENLRK